MRKFVLIALLVSGCTTTADLRSRSFIEIGTSKSTQDFAACLTQQWQSRTGTTNMTPRQKGVTLTLSYVVFSSTVPAVTVDIDDDGKARSVSVYARKGDANDKLRGEISACV